MAILLIAEHANGQLKPATLKALAAAVAIGGDIDLLVIGHQVDAVASAAARIPAVAKVLVADAPAYAHLLAETIAPVIAELAPDYTHIVAAATTGGKNVMPRVAAMLDVQQVSDIVAVCAPDTFVRPIYAGNALATVRSTDAIKVLTVRIAAFDAVAADGGHAAVEALPPLDVAALSRFVGQEIALSERPELSAARIIVAGGRGMQNGDNFSLLDELAGKLGAAVGASRAAVDAGFVPNDYQIGQTGKIVAPELYIAVGISGAIQHLAGMKDSKLIVAINKDEEAPIFQVADYWVVGDLFQLVPELSAALSQLDNIDN
jgi:electron transfer flavoprotein alpha subunit